MVRLWLEYEVAKAVQAAKDPASVIPSSSITPVFDSLYHITWSASSGSYFCPSEE